MTNVPPSESGSEADIVSVWIPPIVLLVVGWRASIPGGASGDIRRRVGGRQTIDSDSVVLLSADTIGSMYR